MRLSFTYYYIVVLIIASQHDLFYSEAGVIASHYSNLNNRTKSHVPALAIRFKYKVDYKSVGDKCNAKGITGVCTLISKCPEVIREIREGRNPIVCSYEVSEAIVCCPKQNTQPNQPDRFDKQGSSSNHTSRQANKFYNPSQIFQNAQPTKLRQTYRETISNSVRRSERKCVEYSRPAVNSVIVQSLAVMMTRQQIITPNCIHPNPLIVGGDTATAGEFPHMAAIGWISSRKVWKCGGSLISENFVLTAAHCSSVNGIPPDIVRLGDQNLVRHDDANPQEYKVASVNVHPKYRRSSIYYDIALIRLTLQVTFNKFIRPACLWQNNFINSTKALATGWGRQQFSGVRSDELKKVSLNIVDNNHCHRLYKPAEKMRKGIVSSQLCAGYVKGGKGTCQGDSGGPIQVTSPTNQCLYYIIGITSFGRGCAAANAPGVYTRVSSYLNWIESIVWP